MKNSVKKQKTKRTGSNVSAPFVAVMLAWPLLHLLVFSVLMNLMTLANSFLRYDGETAIFAGFMRYTDIFKDIFKYGGGIRAAALNSLTFLPLNVFVILPLAIFFSYFIYKNVFAYKTFRVIFFLPSIISVVVLIMAFRYMFDDRFGPMTKLLEGIGLGGLHGNGWFETRWKSYGMLWIYLLWSGIGYNIVLVQGSMIRVPKEVIESSKIDGAGMFRELFEIIIPMIFSTVATMILFGALGTFTLFVQPQLMFGSNSGSDLYTLPLCIVNLTRSGGLNGQASASALGVIVTIVGAPIMILLRWFLNKITPDVEV